MANILNIISYKILPAQSGGQKAIALFCKYLGIEHTLTAVSVKDNDLSLAENYELLAVFSTSRLRYINVLYYFKLKKIIREKNIEYVITEHPYMAWLGFLMKKNLNLKWYIRSHNIEFERFRSLHKWWWSILKTYEGWAYRNADKVFFITKEDAKFAMKKLNLPETKSALLVYGIEQKELLADEDEQREKIFTQYNIPQQNVLMLFNGALDYEPNYAAVDFIINKLNPLLLQRNIQYTIMICGRNLSSKFNELKSYRNKNIIYAGFVNDIENYYKAAKIFLNPVIKGGGVKTKLVEAIAYSNTVISSESGAAGMNISVCGKKLIIVPDNDAEAFAANIQHALNTFENTPHSYYEYYYWGNVVKRINL